MTNVAKSFQLDVLASDKGRNRNLRRKDKSTNQYNNLQTLHRDGERQLALFRYYTCRLVSVVSWQRDKLQIIPF